MSDCVIYTITRPPQEHILYAYHNIIYVRRLPFQSLHVEISSNSGLSLIVQIRKRDIIPEGVAWINSKLREYLSLKVNDSIFVKEIARQSYLSITPSSTILFEVGLLNDAHHSSIIYNSDDIARGLAESENAYSVFTVSQPVIIWMPEDPKTKLLLTVLDITEIREGKVISLKRGRKTEYTILQLVSNKTCPVKLELAQRRVFNVSDVDIVKLGIGGANREFEEMVRSILAPRLISKKWQDRLDIKHEKGIIFHGPPGTGKTLMARNLCKLLNTREPKIVRGPEIMSKFVGEAERNIRMLFQEAEDDYRANGDNADIHIIVFDEIDCIADKRKGEGSNADINNKIVAQLLSVIDGVTTFNNIILIGTTNRLDMLDEALIRPGRFGVKIAFSLPNLEGREQIFKIHMAKILEWNLVDEDVTINDLALRTENYTGAEIEAVVRKALSYVIMNEVDLSNLHTIEDFNSKINHAHFVSALQEIKPAYGASEDLSVGTILNHSDEFQYLLDRLKECVNQLVASKVINNSSILLHGASGSGKTTLSIKTALDSLFPYVKVINTEKLLNIVNETDKAKHIIDVFQESHKSQSAVIILDDIEDLIQYVKMGSRYSSYIYQAIISIITAKVSNKTLIIGTTSKLSVLEDMGLAEKFREVLSLPFLNVEYLTKLLGYKPTLSMTARDAMLELEKISTLSC